jgi:hypothetical protein
MPLRDSSIELASGARFVGQVFFRRAPRGIRKPENVVNKGDIRE